jgi:hypothetical protein
MDAAKAQFGDRLRPGKRRSSFDRIIDTIGDAIEDIDWQGFQPPLVGGLNDSPVQMPWRASCSWFP